MLYLIVFLGAGIGGALRHGVNVGAARLFGYGFPFGTLIVNILGSFFPAWLICIVVGVVLTVLSRQLFVAVGVASDLRPAGLVYPCLGGLWIFATWLVLFGS